MQQQSQPLRWGVLFLGVVVAATLGACNLRMAAVPAPQATYLVTADADPLPAPQSSATVVPPGYRAEVVVTDLTYPSSVAFDDAGNLYVAESGFVYGDPAAPARLLRIAPDGAMHYITDQLNGPVTDLLWHNGQLYISHRGKISILQGDTVRDIVTDLPSFGDHHNNQLAAGPDGRIYFGQGTATNSGVVGMDNFLYQWLPRHPEGHDYLPYDVSIDTHTYTTINPFVMAGGEGSWFVHTTPFAPFGQSGGGVREVLGVRPANGAIMRMNADGTNLQVYAWGLRNPFGLVWARDGQLYAANNGFDERGSRPIANDTDQLYVIEPNAWYGWPDYAGGMPVTDARYESRLGSRPRFILREHPPVEKPVIHFPAHSGVAKLATGSHERFGDPGHLYLAIFGPMTPLTGEQPVGQRGYEVVRIDTRTWAVTPFFTNRDRPESLSNVRFNGGIRRPVDVTFSPDGKTLYVVDIGAIEVLPTRVPTIEAKPGTGVVWRIVPEGVEPMGPPANLSVLPGRGRDTPPEPTRAVGVNNPHRPGAFPSE